MSFSQNLQKFNLVLCVAAVFLIPLFFLPITSDFYEFNKQVLLFVLAGIALVVWTLRFVVDRQVRLTRSPLGLAVAGFAAVWVISAVLNTPNKWDAFFDPGQTGTILSLAVLFFVGINSVHAKKHVELIVHAFLVSVGVVGVIVVLFGSGLGSAISPIAFTKSPLWTPVGNPFTGLVFLTVGVVFALVLLLKIRFKGSKTTSGVATFALIAGLLAGSVMTYRLFLTPGTPNRPVFLAQDVSWSIALETMKTSPIFGTGPATYLSNFTRFRPISYNLSDNWAVRFASSSNYYLQLLSTVGIAGVGMFVLIVVRTAQMAVKAFRTSPESTLHGVVVASSVTSLLLLISHLFLPASLTSLAAVFFLSMITVAGFKQLGSSLVHEANIDIVAANDSGMRTPVLPIVAFVVSLLLVGVGGYFVTRSYAAELYFQQALLKAAANDGRGTYELLIKAYTTNPMRDAYRVAYSQTNLLLANALAGKKDLTNDDRTNIASLIQQSIREAKNAVALNPSKVTNVENLASIYQAVIPLAKGADAWTVASYRAAIQLDPANPNLRIALGGVLYQLKQYDAAIQMFQQAADLKPTLANAYYNLAAAYREKGDIERAAMAMQLTINNVKRDSADYTKATAELEELKKRLNQKAATTPVDTKNEPAQTTLETPLPLPSPRISPQVELPRDLGPDVNITPEPLPTPTPAVSPRTTP